MLQSFYPLYPTFFSVREVQAFLRTAEKSKRTAQNPVVLFFVYILIQTLRLHGTSVHLYLNPSFSLIIFFPSKISPRLKYLPPPPPFLSSSFSCFFPLSGETNSRSEGLNSSGDQTYVKNTTVDLATIAITPAAPANSHRRENERMREQHLIDERVL